MAIAATILDMAIHPAPPLSVNESDLEILRALVRARTTEQRLVQRARIVLRVAPMTVLLSRERYERPGLAGLADDARPGRPPAGEPGDDERDDRLADLADGRSQAHRTGTFKFSTDPDLEAKVRDVVGCTWRRPSGRSC